MEEIEALGMDGVEREHYRQTERETERNTFRRRSTQRGQDIENGQNPTELTLVIHIPQCMKYFSKIPNSYANSNNST